MYFDRESLVFFQDILLSSLPAFISQPGDIAEEVQCKKIIDETVAKFKRIDILVNNAAHQGKYVASFPYIYI